MSSKLGGDSPVIKTLLNSVIKTQGDSVEETNRTVSRFENPEIYPCVCKNWVAEKGGITNQYGIMI